MLVSVCVCVCSLFVVNSEQCLRKTDTNSYSTILFPVCCSGLGSFLASSVPVLFTICSVRFFYPQILYWYPILIDH